MKSYLGFMEDVPSVLGEVLELATGLGAVPAEVTLRGFVIEVGFETKAIAPTVEVWL